MCWSDLYVGVVKSRVRQRFLSMCVCGDGAHASGLSE